MCPDAPIGSDTVPASSVSGTSVESVATASDPARIDLSVVVPTFNEHASVEGTIGKLYEESPLDPSALEVIVADESTDKTPDIVRSLDYQNLRLLRFDRDMGLARSVIVGFKTARGEYLGVIDADGQHPPRKLYELFETGRRGDFDVVVASRYSEGGGIENWSVYRRLVSVGATAIARTLLIGRPTVLDPMSGFFVVRRSVIEDVTLDPIGYKILLDILVRAAPNRVAEVGYVFTEREHGESNLDYSEYIKYIAHVGSLSRHRLAKVL
jgi:dolichol-phosphate mannosyltransferase